LIQSFFSDMLCCSWLYVCSSEVHEIFIYFENVTRGWFQGMRAYCWILRTWRRHSNFSQPSPRGP
jgi:hypothetical protein